VAMLAEEIAATGAVGINLEDGVGTPELLMEKIHAIRQTLGDTPLFINARTDVYLGGLASGRDAVDMAVHRLSRYQNAGADGGFVPGIADIKDIAEIAVKVTMPINVMTVPGLPSLQSLHEAGVRRISAGPALFQHTFGAGMDGVEGFLAGNFSSAPRSGIDYATLNRLLS
jgi:2-methylisocitrate lyase-like PEP mutase family enzyme